MVPALFFVSRRVFLPTLVGTERTTAATAGSDTPCQAEAVSLLAACVALRLLQQYRLHSNCVVGASGVCLVSLYPSAKRRSDLSQVEKLGLGFHVSYKSGTVCSPFISRISCWQLVTGHRAVRKQAQRLLAGILCRASVIALPYSLQHHSKMLCNEYKHICQWVGSKASPSQTAGSTTCMSIPMCIPVCTSMPSVKLVVLIPPHPF